MPNPYHTLDQIDTWSAGRVYENLFEQLDKRRSELKDWRRLLTEEQRHQVDFANLYAGHFEQGLADGHLLVLISALCDLLDSAATVL